MSCELEGVVLAVGEAIPAEGVVVVVASEEDAARAGEGDGGDATEDLVVTEAVDLVIAPEVEEAAAATEERKATS